jgi:arsenate reductase
LALAAIDELGLSSDGLRSKHVDEFLGRRMDLVITVCDHAKEACPVFPNAGETLHWPFDDPADASGDDEAKMLVFRRVRDEIRAAIAEYLATQGVS